MRHAHQRGFLAETVEYLAPRLAGLPGVVVRPHAEARVAPLNGRVDHIAGDQRVMPGTADQHGVMVDGVAGGRNELNLLGKRKIAFHDLRTLGLDDRQHGVGDPGHGCRILLLLLRPVRELALRHHVFRLRERRHPASVLEPRVPADMIPMQVGAHDVIDVLRLDPDAGEVGEVGRTHPMELGSRRALLVVA